MKKRLLYFSIILGIGAIALLGWRYDVVIVVGTSMKPTLVTSDILIVDTWFYRSEDPDRGDVLVARYEMDLIVKRVAGLPAEEVAIKAGQLWIDGRRRFEPHVSRDGSLWIAPGRLQKGRFAIVGDNRNISIEESVHGVVGKDDIVGKVVFTFSIRSLPQFLFEPSHQSS